MITIGLDIGTTSISGVVFDSTEQSVLTTETLPNNSRIEEKEPWQNIQDTEKIWNACQKIIARCQSKYPAISAIGLTGQMHGIVYLDKSGRAISPLATWQDARGDQSYRDGKSYTEFLTHQSGYRMSSGYGLTTHFYNQKNKMVPDGTASLCTIADYIGLRLTRRKKPLIHTSNAHSMGVFDLNNLTFDRDAINDAGINPGILPEVSPGEISIGWTTNGIPVCVAIGDNQASFIGAVGDTAHILTNIGTGSQLSVRSKTMVYAEGGLEVRPFVNGEFLLVGAGLSGGSAYALLRDLFREVLGLYDVKADEELYGKMENAARETMESKNPLAVDTRFKGTRRMPDIRGAIKQIGMNNLTAGQLALGVMQGICEELHRFYQLVPEALRKADVLVGSGNALRNNKTLREILSDRFGMALTMSPFIEEGAIGAGILAATMLE